MDRDDLFYLGYIAKARGIKGEVSFFLDVDQPQDYKELESVFVEINKEPVPFFIEYIRIKDKGFASVKFEDINTEADAKALVKKRLFAPLDWLPALTGTKFYYHEVEGYTVVDELRGEIGRLNRVLDYSANPLLEIKFGNAEVLIPINDETILELDRSNKVMKVAAPEGLLDLYLGANDTNDADTDQ